VKGVKGVKAFAKYYLYTREKNFMKVNFSAHREPGYDDEEAL